MLTTTVVDYHQDVTVNITVGLSTGSESNYGQSEIVGSNNTPLIHLLNFGHSNFLLLVALRLISYRSWLGSLVVNFVAPNNRLL